MLEGLNPTFMPPHHTPERVKERLWPAPRSAPVNVGAHLRATHPCIRTNPVTGWKSLYAFGHHLERIEGLGDVENRMMLEFTTRLITENHQLQARVRWEKDDLVVWDNRAVYHVSAILCHPMSS
jgi:alpha-ketoglutarate-dependent taurine dioxygenase